MEGRKVKRQHIRRAVRTKSLLSAGAVKTTLRMLRSGFRRTEVTRLQSEWAFDIRPSAVHRPLTMHARPLSIAIIAATLVFIPSAAMPEIYKWVEPDGSVHYGNTAPSRTKNVRMVGIDSGTVSVVPGMSKEQIARLREREDQLRLQRLEREVEELRAREQSREYAQPEVIYTEVYVPAYGYGHPLHRRNRGHVKPRPDHPIVKPRPPHRTQPIDELTAPRAPTGVLIRR